MATTHVSQSTNGLAIDTAIASTSLNALANGSYAIGTSAINNSPTDGTTVSYLKGDLTITLSSAVTTGSGTPYVTVWLLPAVDGTNYPNPPGTTAGAAPSSNIRGTYTGVASTSTTTITVEGMDLPPYNFYVQVQNNLGIAFPSTNTSTCKLQRTTIANW
jgi:hypothetical protein